jgi:regulator of cell morphogenesis and NO signaling
MDTLEMLTVGQLVAENPARSRVFERLGIDYCCGGKRTLDTVCAEKGLNPQEVLRELNSCVQSGNSNERDWLHASLTELADNIEQTHHAFLKSELPRLAELIAKVAKVHGAAHPEIVKVHEIFQQFRAELEQHMQKEELILFPICRQLTAATSLPGFHCGSICNPIRVMELEHEAAGTALHAFRQLTNDYALPDGVCRSYQAMLAGLADIESDMHQHVHKENNVLFPRAIELEAALSKNG